MKQTWRLISELAKENAIKAIKAAPIRDIKPYEVTVEEEEENRSLKQNAFYWQRLHQASMSSGMDAESLHYICKKQFLGYREVELCGEVHEIPNSTAKLNTKRFAEYCTQVEAWLAEQGLLQVWA